MTDEGLDPVLVPPHLQPALTACRLGTAPRAWAHLDHWTLRLPDGEWGLALLTTWAMWQHDPHAPQRLHWLARTQEPPLTQDWERLGQDWPHLKHLAQACAQACWGLLPGLHRLAWADGRVQLSLWVGESAACQRWWDQTPHQVWGQPPTLSGSTSTADRGRPNGAPRRAALVLGGGLAGASAARALATHGFEVTVLDAGPTPAHGASGLPVGLMTPHVSGDDNPLSRLTRAGLRQVLAHARAHLQAGEDWSPSGLLERRLSGKARRGRWPLSWVVPTESDAFQLMGAAQDWFAPASDAQHLSAGLPPPEPGFGLEPKGIWHTHAGWMKPARLVASLLDHPHIHWCGNTRVVSLQPGTTPGTWVAVDEQGHPHPAEQVVIALGPSSLGLLAPLLPNAHWPLEPLRGQVTGGPMASAMASLLPPHPVNGLGSLISQVPMGDDGPMWWYGSTYDHSRQEAVCLAADQATNLAQLQSLLPQLAGWVPETEDADAFATTKTLGLRNWAGVRCTTPDRLPVVGSLAPLGAPGVHLLTALGSRGITLSMLCGHLLAAQICGEPWPMDPAIAHLLRPERFKNQT